jgi:hypothetical protein
MSLALASLPYTSKLFFVKMKFTIAAFLAVAGLAVAMPEPQK